MKKSRSANEAMKYYFPNYWKEKKEKEAKKTQWKPLHIDKEVK